jgi:hypothetical protein
MCDSETGWFEIAETRDKSSGGTSKILDQIWLFSYSHSNRCNNYNGNEFLVLGKEFQ